MSTGAAVTTQLTVSRQGLGAVNADQLNTYGQTCDSLTDLRGFIGITGVQVYARGTSAPNDGGQGQFYWDDGSTGADDNFSIIVPNGVLQGAWLRLSQDVGPWLQMTPSYANDAAAAAGGVPVGGLYRTASAISIRVT